MQSLLCAILWVLVTLLPAAGAEIYPAGEQVKDFHARACEDSDAAGLLQVAKEPTGSPKTGQVLSVPLESQGWGSEVTEAPAEEALKHGRTVRRTAAQEVLGDGSEEATLGPEEMSFHRGRKYSRFKWYMHAIRPPHMTNTTQIHQSVWRHVVGTIGACVATFSVNFIDVVWIMPFLNDKVDGTWNAMFFMAMSQILATASIIIFAIKGVMEERNHNGSLERSIDLVTGILLCAYGFYLLYEAHFCHAPSSPEKANEDSDDDSCHKEVTHGSYGRRQFMILCAVGGLDQVAVYIPVLTTQVLNGVELELGVLVSTLASVAMCLFLGKSDFLKRAVEAIPLWLIVFALGAASFVQYIMAA